MFPQDLIRDFPDLFIGTGFSVGASIRFVDIITYLMVKELFLNAMIGAGRALKQKPFSRPSRDTLFEHSSTGQGARCAPGKGHLQIVTF